MTAIIFDCDTGVDDAMAIMYGAGNGAEFVACTVTHGNVPVAVGARNTLTILDAITFLCTSARRVQSRSRSRRPNGCTARTAWATPTRRLRLAHRRAPSPRSRLSGSLGRGRGS